MTRRDSGASLAAGYQLMASYLVWDLRDLVSKGSLIEPDARGRLRQFVEMLQAAQRATEPVYPAHPEQAPAGNARAERSKRLASANQDEQLFEILLAARGSGDKHEAGVWAEHAFSVLKGVEDHDWTKPADKENLRFIEQDVEPFLRRLGRIDQIDRYRPAWRPGLKRR
jgi:hypothetical protein